MRAQVSIPSISGIMMSRSTMSAAGGLPFRSRPISRNFSPTGRSGRDIAIAAADQRGLDDLARFFGVVDDQDAHVASVFSLIFSMAYRITGGLLIVCQHARRCALVKPPRRVLV